MAQYIMDMIIGIDTRWPRNEAEPDKNVLEGRINGYRMFGWWTEEQLQQWLARRRRGAIETLEDGKRRVLVNLTYTEYKNVPRNH